MKRSPTSSCSSSSSSSPFDSKKAKRIIGAENESTSRSSGRRSSIYRGVTRHRWTGRYEAHLWDKSSWNAIQNKKGRQVYLGAYDSEEAAAHTYDLAALKYWGPDTTLNFPISSYTEEIEGMQKVSKEEYLASLRRRSSGFSRGVSKYRGVARHHHNGRWEARIGRVLGNKYLYLGTYDTQEEAAAAYDMAAIEHRGPNAVTNFDMSNYIDCINKKPLPLDQVPLPKSPIQPEQQVLQVEHQQQQLQYTSHLTDNSTMPVNMDSAHEHELNWSFGMDAGFTHLRVPEFPLEKAGELPDLFKDSGFEDDIDLIFEAGYNNNANEVGLECVYGVEVGVLGGKEECGKEKLSTSSSSLYSSSTTTSVSYNYSVSEWFGH